MVSNNLQKQNPFAGVQLLPVSTGEPENATRQDETFTPHNPEKRKGVTKCYMNSVRARTWYIFLPQEVMNIKKAKLKITIYWQRFSSYVSQLKSVSSETVVISIMWPSASVPHFLKCTILRNASVFQVILEGKKLLESSCSSIVYLLLWRK